jgi:general secretion pathway protein M
MALATAWQQRAPRERRALTLGAAVLLVAAVWRLLVAPAWQVWHEAPARQATLEAQTRQMLQLQAQARQMPLPSRIERAQALSLLNVSAQALLGPRTQLTPQGDELRVTLHAAPASGLTEWLAQAREKAQARPRLAQLQQQAVPDQNTEVASGPTWNGTLVLQLP